MFRPLQIFNQYDLAEQRKCISRWDDNKRIELEIIEMIIKGGGEDFLQYEFESGNFPILENYLDLRGIRLGRLNILFPKIDNFEGIDFKYSTFTMSTFENATIIHTSFDYARFRNFKFINCTFLFSTFYYTYFENAEFINCDFIERNKFFNSDFKNAKLKSFYTPERLFYECRFDDLTIIDDPRDIDCELGKHKLDKINLSEIYKGIKEGYSAGEVTKKEREFFLKEKKSYTKFNLKSYKKLGYYLLDLFTGYGALPQRAFFLMITLYTLFTFIFALFAKVCISDSFLLSAGAFFTFGAKNELLNDLPFFWHIIYILESFLGIGSMAIFITILANFWFKEKG